MSIIEYMEKIPKFKAGDKVNAYTVERAIINEKGPIWYSVKCKCEKSLKIVQASLIKSPMCITCSAQSKASKPRPAPGQIIGTYTVHRLAYDGKTNDERRYECTCRKCGIKTYVSERKLHLEWPCGFCKY